MPHCILEYSDNVPDHPEPRDVLLGIHDALMATGLFTSGDIKGRAVRHRDFLAGDGAADRTFISVEVQIMSGRDEAVKARIAEDVLAVIEAHFPLTRTATRCSLTVQVNDIDRASYRRIRDGVD